MQHHEAAGDRQAEPGAVDRVRGMAVRALERAEHALQRIGRNSDAGDRLRFDEPGWETDLRVQSDRRRGARRGRQMAQ